MFESKFLHTDIYISYKDTTIVVVCSDDKETMSLEKDGSKELRYYRVNKQTFYSLVAKLLNRDIGNGHKKDSKYFYIYSSSNLMKVFDIIGYIYLNMMNEKLLKLKK